MTGVKRYRRMGAGILMFFVGVLAFSLLISPHGLAQSAARYIDAIRLSNGGLFERNFWPFLLLYFVSYVITVMACLPTTALMAVIGGLMFGYIAFPVAILSLSAGSIVPFLLSCKLSKFATAHADSRLLDGIRSKFLGNQFQYLILLRLIPWAPFSVSTIVVGSLGMSMGSFLIATAIGSMPATLAFTAIGHGVQRLSDLGEISAERLYREPDFLMAAAGVILVVVLSFSRRIPLISRLLG